MSPESRTKLKQLLVSHESYRQFPYVDSTGHLTVGIGRNLQSRGISTIEAFYLLDDDISYFNSKLEGVLSFFNELDDNRKVAVVDMCFNLGINGFLEFNRFISALETKDYQKAHDELLNSKAAIQCPDRYRKLAQIILTGDI